jgi:hypothetical protein
MNRKPKSQRRRVKALTDPHPEFVSLVQAGANMTPFKAVKSEDAQKSDTHTLVKVAFRAEQFADEASVKAWLDDGGYENYEIAKTDEGFEVKSAAADEIDETDLSVIEMEGLSLFVMKLDEPTGEAVEKQPSDVTAVDGETVAKADEAEDAVEAEAAETEEVAKADEPAAPELRAKFDDMMAHYSNKDTLSGVLADGFDGLPPGFFELTGAMYTAVRNACMGGDLEGVRRIASEYGDMVARMAALFPMNDDMTLTQRTALFEALAPEIALVKAEAPAEAVEAEAVEAVETEAAKAETTEETVETEQASADEPVKPVAKEEAETEAAPVVAEVSEEAEPETAAKADEAPVDALAALVGAVAQLTEQVGSLHKDLATKADALAVRVDALEGRQTRKSADVEEDVQASPAKAQKSGSSDFQTLALRGALGIARRTF